MLKISGIKIQYSHLGLLICFLIFFLISPLIPQPYGKYFLDLSFSLILFSTLFTLSRRTITIKIGLLIGIPAIILNTYLVNNHNLHLDIINLTLSALLVLLVALVMFGNVFLADETIHVDLIFGAIVIYILLALFWSALYGIIELSSPGSFAGINDIHERVNGVQSYNQHVLVYYSFVTQTTLGFGDIHPTTTMPRNLSAVQAVIGQFYIATLVSALIGMFLRQKD